jgi:hypothetical protein
MLFATPTPPELFLAAKWQCLFICRPNKDSDSVWGKQTWHQRELKLCDMRIKHTFRLLIEAIGRSGGEGDK